MNNPLWILSKRLLLLHTTGQSNVLIEMKICLRLYLFSLIQIKAKKPQSFKEIRKSIVMLDLKQLVQVLLKSILTENLFA